MNNDYRIDSNSLNNSIKKISMYVEEEEKSLRKIAGELTELSNSYKSNNSNKLSKIDSNILIKFNTISDNRKKYIFQLKNSIENYDAAEKTSINIFNSIN